MSVHNPVGPVGAIYVLYQDFISKGNVGIGETILSTFALPANFLNANGSGIRIHTFGTVASNGNVKRIRLFFGGTGGTELCNNTVDVASSTFWQMEARVHRTGVGTQVAYGYRLISTITNYRFATTFPVQDETLPINIQMVCPSAVATGDVVFKGMVIEALPSV